MDSLIGLRIKAQEFSSRCGRWPIRTGFEYYVEGLCRTSNTFWRD